MEFKVWVDGIQRVVCGVTSQTTCHDIILALAHATGQTGRFTLLEQWRENEQYLVPTDRPLQLLQKWGEYGADVQFVLRKSRTGERWETHHDLKPPPPNVRRCFTFSGAQLSARESSSSSDTHEDEIENKARPRASVSPFNSKITEKKSSPSHAHERITTPVSSPERVIRSPGSGSSLPSPQNSLDPDVPTTNIDFLTDNSFKFDREEFTRKIIEKGKTDDLSKFIALQQERLKLLEEESEFIDGELSKDYRSSELESLRLKENSLIISISELDAYDDTNGPSDQGLILAGVRAEIQTLRAKIDCLNSQIQNQEIKIRTLMEEIDKTLREEEMLESERQAARVRLHEAELVQSQLQADSAAHAQTDAALQKAMADIRNCDQKIRARQDLVAELEKQLKSLNLESFTKAPSTDSSTCESKDTDYIHNVTSRSPSSHRANRRLVVNPQRLADTAPTINNPYGMWV